MSEKELRENVNCIRTLLKTRGHTLTKKEVAELIDGVDLTDLVAATEAIVTTLNSRPAEVAAPTTTHRSGRVPTVRLAIDEFVAALPSDLPSRDAALGILARYVVKPKKADEDISVWRERLNAQLGAWNNSTPEVNAETASGTTEVTLEVTEDTTPTTEYNF